MRVENPWESQTQVDSLLTHQLCSLGLHWVHMTKTEGRAGILRGPSCLVAEDAEPGSLREGARQFGRVKYLHYIYGDRTLIFLLSSTKITNQWFLNNLRKKPYWLSLKYSVRIS